MQPVADTNHGPFHYDYMLCHWAIWALHTRLNAHLTSLYPCQMTSSSVHIHSPHQSDYHQYNLDHTNTYYPCIDPSMSHLAQLNLAALHSQSLPVAFVSSRLSCQKAVSSCYLLPATEVDSNIVKGGGMRTWNPFALVFSIPTQHSYILDCWPLEMKFYLFSKRLLLHEWCLYSWLLTTGD